MTNVVKKQDPKKITNVRVNVEIRNALNLKKLEFMNELQNPNLSVNNTLEILLNPSSKAKYIGVQ